MSPIYSGDHLTIWQLLPHIPWQINIANMHVYSYNSNYWLKCVNLHSLHFCLTKNLSTYKLIARVKKRHLNWLTIGRIAWMSNYLWKENLFLPKVEKWLPAQDLKQQPFSIIHSTQRQNFFFNSFFLSCLTHLCSLCFQVNLGVRFLELCQKHNY